MKKAAILLASLAFSVSLSSCSTMADSLFEGPLAKDDENHYESREKRQRRAQYRSGNKPSLQLD